MRDLLRLLFGLTRPVDRRTYAFVGLMLGRFVAVLRVLRHVRSEVEGTS